MPGGPVTFWLAFVAGLASFFSPCVLPLIPIYVAYLGGTSKDSKNKLIIINSLGFVLGFTVIFILMGASATMLGQFLLANQTILQKIAGLIIIIFGLQLTQVINIPFLNLEKRRQIKNHSTGFGPSVLFGLAFGSGWTPCIGPILGSILALASTTSSLIYGVGLLLIYALGLAFPFFLAALLMNSLKDKWSQITKKTLWLNRLAGVILVIFGIMLFFGYLQTISRYLPNWGL